MASDEKTCVVGGCEKPAVVAVDWVGPPREEWFRFCEEHDPRNLKRDTERSDGEQ